MSFLIIFLSIFLIICGLIGLYIPLEIKIDKSKPPTTEQIDAVNKIFFKIRLVGLLSFIIGISLMVAKIFS